MDHFDEKYLNGLLSRRELMRAAGLLGIGVPALLGMSNLAAGQSEQPRPGGIMTAVFQSDPANFDPMSNTSYATLWAIGPCYNSLLRTDPHRPDEVVGDLAQSWDLSPDGKIYTFKLVQNAKFHDGEPLTSADVKYTFDILRNPPTGYVSLRKSLFSAVKEIETPDPYTVQFVLDRVSPSFLSNLAIGWLLVLPKHILERGPMKDTVIGSGPFMFKEYVRGVSIELVRNPNYHVKDRPYIDGIKYFVVPDATTRYAYIRTGQVDFYELTAANEARRAQKEDASTTNVYEIPSLTGDSFSINSRRKPFDDIRVRKALALSIDHEEAVKVVMAGNGQVGGLMPSGKWALPPDELEKIAGFGKDVEANRIEAKRLLAEAGYPNGFETTLTGRRGVGTHDDRVVFLADQFSRIGVQAKIDLQETAAYFDNMGKRNFNLATTTIGAPANDPDAMLSDYHTCNGSANWSGVCQPELDALFLKQSQTIEEDERKKLVHQVEILGLNGFGTISLYYPLKFTITSKRVQNYVQHPNNENNVRFDEVQLSQP